MGWNSITLKSLKDEFIKSLNQREFYFLHSFHCVPDDKELIISTAFYGEDFCSCIKMKGSSNSAIIFSALVTK